MFEFEKYETISITIQQDDIAAECRLDPVGGAKLVSSIFDIWTETDLEEASTEVSHTAIEQMRQLVSIYEEQTQT